MPPGSLRSPLTRALTISLSAMSPCTTTLLPPAMRESDDQLALGDLRQQRRLLRLIAGEPQCRAGQHDARQIRLQRQHPAERLHDQHRLDAAAAEPAIFLG